MRKRVSRREWAFAVYHEEQAVSRETVMLSHTLLWLTLTAASAKCF